MEKFCSKCKETKPLSCFGLMTGKRRDGEKRRPYCRTCKGKFFSGKNNAEKRARLRREKHRKIVATYLSTHPCVDCGEADLLVLEFDHVDPATKTSSVTHFLHRRMSTSLLLTEMAKCEVRCANCHKRRTARQFGSWRLHVSVH